MNTPILFLIFNRPDTTAQVFETIRSARPTRLYIAADGPRKNKEKEKEKCVKARDIVTNIDWECEVKTLFREENLGCGRAIYEAVSWFFSQEEKGIILEDDIIAHPDFFNYCEILLERYKNNPEVGIISGRNHLYGEKVSEDSYYFATISHVWGWATWRRTWDLYKYNINDYPYTQLVDSLNSLYKNNHIKRFWKWIYILMGSKKAIDTWDYQLTLSMIINRRLNIVPNINLIQNIGFREDATHTLTADKKKAEYKGMPIFPLIHPNKIELNRSGDELDLISNRCAFSKVKYFRKRFKLILKTMFKKKK